MDYLWQNPRVMKFYRSLSLSVVYCLFLLVLTACKPEYTIETVVELNDPEAASEAARQRLAERLQDRLGATFGTATRLEPTDSGFRILSPHTGQPTAEMGKLVGATGSVEFAIYDLCRATDPEVQQHLALLIIFASFPARTGPPLPLIRETFTT